MKNQILNQDELRVKRHQLDLEGRFLRATVQQLTGEVIAPPALEGEQDDILATERLETHVALLQAKLSALPKLTLQPAAPAIPSAKAPVAAQASAVSTPKAQAITPAPKASAADQGQKKRTATERCQAAKRGESEPAKPQFIGASARCAKK